jgi:hypothetical protein
VRPQDPSVVDGAFDGAGRDSAGHAKSERPFRHRILLRLHGAKPPDHILDGAWTRSREALVQ